MIFTLNFHKTQKCATGFESNELIIRIFSYVPIFENCSILIFDCDVGEWVAGWVGGSEKVQTCAEVTNGWYLSVFAKVFHRLRAPFLPPESGLCVFKLWRLPLLGDPTDGCIGCGWRLLKSWNRLLYDEILNILNVSKDVVLYNSRSRLLRNSYAFPPRMQSE